jgi:predicted Zn-dependent protease
MFVHSFSGMEDPLAGGMELKSKKGYLIEKGRVGRVLSMLTLTENVPDFIASIDAVGKKDQFDVEHATCGKGHEDMVPVGDGGVYIRAEAVVGQG